MMKAAVIDVDRVTVESIPDPTPGPREVVVAVAGVRHLRHGPAHRRR